MEGRHISRVFYDGEQYVSFYEIIKTIRDIGDDFCEQDLHEACSALEWVAEQLQFAMNIYSGKNCNHTGLLPEGSALP